MDIEELLERYRQLADRYAPARAQREYLDEYKKSMLALLMKDAERAGYNSGVAQDREARANDKYLELLDNLKTAVFEEEKIRYHMKATEWEIEIWRTKQANERAERRAYGA
jgi:non-homologous end joining protein Ku